MANREKNVMPYNTKMELFKQMLNFMKSSGKKGIAKETFWNNLGLKDWRNSAYTLSMLDFLKLVEDEGDTVKLTKLGETISAVSEARRNTLLIQSLPDRYKTIVNWILHKKEMSTREVMDKYIEIFGKMSSDILLERAMVSFIGYCLYLNLITKDGQGDQAKLTVTEFGKDALSGNYDATPTESSQAPKLESPKEDAQVKIQKKPISLSDGQDFLLDADWPITIIVKEKPAFRHAIDTDADWSLVDSFINSYKEKHKAEKRGDKGSLKDEKS